MSSKKTFLFLIFSLITLTNTEHIEIPLYKSEVKFDEKMEDYVENIEKSNFMTDLKLGTPEQTLPFQIEMTLKDTCVLKKRFDDNKSKTYKRLDTNLQCDKLNLGKKSLDLEMQDYGTVYGNGTLIDESSGILGLSLDGDWFNQQQTKDHKFVNQLKNNKIVSNSVFYFEFNNQNPKNLEQYLNTVGKLTIGDYPYNVVPKKCNKAKTKTAPIQHHLKSDSPVLKDETNSAILFDMHKCIGCQMCVRACSNVAGQNVLKAIGIDPKNKKKKSYKPQKTSPSETPTASPADSAPSAAPKHV